jgi:ElaA protein
VSERTTGFWISDVSFDELGARAAYDVWRLRQQVFVVEQQCPYPDLDGRDDEPGTRHVRLCDPEQRLIGYARVLDDGDVWRIGRVVLEPAARGRGLADWLMDAALGCCAEADPERDVVLDAQSPLAGWYATFGFTPSGPEFLEDGIPHVPMRRPRTVGGAV